ncbi:MAG: PEP-CTERM sorting domain-containing protein [Phycisphaerales bacterium]|nr:PEP-CTERM sorting domain-containing protein [Phycisphaerales bacterium]
MKKDTLISSTCRRALALAAGVVVVGAGSAMSWAAALVPYIDPSGTIYFSDDAEAGSFNALWSGAGSSPQGGGVGALEYSSTRAYEGSKSLHVMAAGTYTRSVNQANSLALSGVDMSAGGYVISQYFYIPTPSELSAGVSDSDFDRYRIGVTGIAGEVMVQGAGGPAMTADTAYLRTWGQGDAGGDKYAPVSRGAWHEMTIWHSDQGVALFIDGKIVRGWNPTDNSMTLASRATKLRYGNTDQTTNGGEIFIDNIVVADARVPDRNVLASHDFSSGAQASAFVGLSGTDPQNAASNAYEVNNGMLHITSNDAVVTSAQYSILSSTDERMVMKFTIAAWDGKNAGDAVAVRLATVHPEEADGQNDGKDILGRFWTTGTNGGWQNGLLTDAGRQYGGTGTINGGAIQVGDTLEVITGRGLRDGWRTGGLTLNVYDSNGNLKGTTGLYASGANQDFPDLMHFGIDNMSGAWLDNFSLSAYQPIPEPASLGLIGLGGLLLMRHRRG